MVTEENIWEYIDGSADGQVRSDVEYAIVHDAATADIYREISAMHDLLAAQSRERLPDSFADQVVRALYPLPEAAADDSVSIASIFIYALPYLLVAALLCVAVSGSAGACFSFQPGPRLIYSAKMLFIVCDVVLLMYFLDEWIYSKRNRLV